MRVLDGQAPTRRPPRPWSDARHGWRPLVAALLLGLAAGTGCARQPRRQPQETFVLLERAVAADDGLGLFDVLDGDTRAAVERCWRAARQLRRRDTQAFPDGAFAPGSLPGLLSPGVTDTSDPRSYFAAVNRQHHFAGRYRKRLGSVSGPIVEKTEGQTTTWVARKQEGMPFRLVRDQESWAFGELQTEWREAASAADRALASPAP
jgi:hypothetical protein